MAVSELLQDRVQITAIYAVINKKKLHYNFNRVIMKTSSTLERFQHNCTLIVIRNRDFSKSRNDEHKITMMIQTLSAASNPLPLFKTMDALILL